MIATSRPVRRQVRRIWPALLLVTAGTAAAASGDLDPSFGLAGRVVIGADTFNAIEGATSVAQQKDGKLLIGRWVYYWASPDDFSVVRLTADGRLDTTFGANGIATFPLQDMQGVTVTVLQLASGKILAAGRTATEFDGITMALGLVRYNANGTVDPSFGNGGIVVTSLGEEQGSAAALVEQPDGRLVIAGHIAMHQGTRDLLIARFNPDGSLDATFGVSGSLIMDVGGALADDGAQALVLQPDGKLLAAGYATDQNGTYPMLLRVTSAGALDATFGQAGVAKVDIPGVDTPVVRDLGGVALQLQSDGKVVVAAEALGSGDECTSVITRLNSDASTDLSFGDSGQVRLPAYSCPWGAGSSIVVEPTGEIVIGHAAGDVVITRLTAAGQLDTAFGTNGRAVIDEGEGWQDSSADTSFGIRLARQADGRLIVVASDQFDWDTGGNYFVVARLLSGGSSAGLIGLVQNYLVVDESAGSVSFQVRRTGGATGAVGVDFVASSDQMPTSATLASGTLTWADGETAPKTISIAFADDTSWNRSGGTSVGLALSNPSGRAGLTTDVGELYIKDNDPAPPPPIPLPPQRPAPQDSNGGGSMSGWTLLILLAAGLARRSAARATPRSLAAPLVWTWR